MTGPLKWKTFALSYARFILHCKTRCLSLHIWRSNCFPEVVSHCRGVCHHCGLKWQVSLYMSADKLMGCISVYLTRWVSQDSRDLLFISENRLFHHSEHRRGAVRMNLSWMWLGYTEGVLITRLFITQVKMQIPFDFRSKWLNGNLFCIYLHGLWKFVKVCLRWCSG